MVAFFTCALCCCCCPCFTLSVIGPSEKQWCVLDAAFPCTENCNQLWQNPPLHWGDCRSDLLLLLLLLLVIVVH